jgi:hypothetical protein
LHERAALRVPSLGHNFFVDLITDFNPADDVMRLEGAVFPTLSSAGTLPASAFRAAPVAGDADDRILYDPDTGFLRYDADGTGATASVRFARLAAGLAITNADFVVQNPVAPPPANYTTQIQPIFNANCISCHAGSGAPGLKLDAQNSFANLVNVNSSEVPSIKRVSDRSRQQLPVQRWKAQPPGVRMPRNRPPPARPDQFDPAVDCRRGHTLTDPLIPVIAVNYQ